MGGWTALGTKLWDSAMAKSQCSTRLACEILTSNQCWLMHFKGRSALAYLGCVRLSCSGAWEGGRMVALPEVTPNRVLPAAAQGLNRKVSARCGLWAGQSLALFSEYKFYSTHSIKCKENSLSMNSNLIYSSPHPARPMENSILVTTDAPFPNSMPSLTCE